MRRPAYPELGNVGHNSDWQNENGMSLREYFAAHAPISMKEAWAIWTDHKTRPMSDAPGAASEREPFLQWFATLRYEYADAMLQEAAGED